VPLFSFGDLDLAAQFEFWSRHNGSSEGVIVTILRSRATVHKSNIFFKHLLKENGELEACGKL